MLMSLLLNSLPVLLPAPPVSPCCLYSCEWEMAIRLLTAPLPLHIFPSLYSPCIITCLVRFGVYIIMAIKYQFHTVL